MRIVADTNVVISGLSWRGPSNRVLVAARNGSIQLFTTGILLAKLQAVLGRAKFASRLATIGVTSDELALGYAALAREVQPAMIPRVVADDPDDDAVLACAVTANVDMITSGDHHLQDLKVYRGIPIVRAATLCERLQLP